MFTAIREAPMTGRYASIRSGYKLFYAELVDPSLAIHTPVFRKHLLKIMEGETEISRCIYYSGGVLFITNLFFTGATCLHYRMRLRWFGDAESEVNVVSLPMVSAENVQEALTSYIDFNSPMGTNIYEPVRVLSLWESVPRCPVKGTR